MFVSENTYKKNYDSADFRVFFAEYTIQIRALVGSTTLTVLPKTTTTLRQCLFQLQLPAKQSAKLTPERWLLCWQSVQTPTATIRRRWFRPGQRLTLVTQENLIEAKIPVRRSIGLLKSLSKAVFQCHPLFFFFVYQEKQQEIFYEFLLPSAPEGLLNAYPEPGTSP